MLSIFLGAHAAIPRIATFSMKQYCHTLRLLQPDYILLNFVNYYKSDFEKLKIRFPKQVRKPTHMGYGPRPQDIAEYDEDALSGILKWKKNSLKILFIKL